MDVENTRLMGEGEIPDLIANLGDKVWEEVELFQE